VSFHRKAIRLGVVVALAFGCAAFTGSAASAQGFFDALFGAFGGRDSQPSPTSYARPSEDGRYPGAAPESHASAGSVRGGGVYCVRLCDGRYFPVPRAAAGQGISSAKVCSALCPRAQTKVFNGGDPTHAVASDGTRYADLENALVYRERVVPDCSCTGQGPGGLARIDIDSDPTLREGDVVVKTTGLVAFKGAASYPYKSADFTPIDSYARIAGDMRKTLSELKVNTTVQSSAPVEKLADARDDTQMQARAKPKPRRARVQETRTRDAWSGNPFADLFR
jgi:hypothetical protein